ncbi:MAG: FCD domain-containing protein, partial [Micrococcales bacterium]|nr:FCD domain-containing protein [Micrococcales bacterium]
LTLAEIEAEYHVSRTSIREAVRVLESHGMLTSRRRVGVIVQPIDNWDVLDSSVIQWRLAGPDRERQLIELMEMRSAVEPVAARFAAERATDDERRQLQELAGRLESLAQRELGNSTDYLTADIAFHTLLLKASRNTLLARMAGPVSGILIGRATLNLLGRIPEEGTVEGHVRTAAAICAGDPVAAAESSASLVRIISIEVQRDQAAHREPATH